MSRSKRKTPVRGMSSSESGKADKSTSHRKLRRVAKTWSMDKDGKRRFDPVAQPRLMRK